MNSRQSAAAVVALALTASITPIAANAAAKAPKAGAACTAKELNTTVGAFTCVVDGRKRVWKAAAAPASTAAPAAGAAPAPAAAAGVKTGPGFDGKTITIGNITSKTNAA